MIVLSVAHTKLAQGAKTAGGLYEYEMSQRASRAAYELLYAANIPAAMFEVGYFTREGCMPVKQLMPSRLAAMCVEIHFNASGETDKANYSEVIHHPASVAGKACAAAVSVALIDGFNKGNHKWPSHGPRGDGSLFFLKGAQPAIIVEGVFGSNPEQAQFLDSGGGPEAYGMLVGEGLKTWWSKR